MSPTPVRNIVSLKLDEIEPSPLNPRKHSASQLSAEELKPLAESLANCGQWELITVRPHPNKPGRYELVNGERRWRAAQLGGVKQLEARVENMTDAQALDMMLTTGEQSEPLSAMALAYGYASRMELEGLNQTQLAAKLGVSKVDIHRHVALLDLPESMQEAVDAGRVPINTAFVVAMVPGEVERAAFAQQVLEPVTQEEPLSYRTALALRSARYARTLNGAPFDVNDAALVASAGPCTACPWRAGNNPEAYGPQSSSSNNTCMKPSCFLEKTKAVRDRVIAKLQAEDGVEALSAEENAAAYPEGESGLNPRARLVEWSRPVPEDLLKKEVAAAGPLRWADICGGDRAAVTVRLGFDQRNRPVKLVRVAEAVAAADLNECAVWNEETRVRYVLQQRPTQTATKRSTKEELTQHSREDGRDEEAVESMGDVHTAKQRQGALEDEVKELVAQLRLTTRLAWKQLAYSERIAIKALLERHGAEVEDLA